MLITYKEILAAFAKRSYAKRKQVAALIVKDNNIVSYGWNGMPKGMNNDCELEDGTTNPLVLHAEENAILKCAYEGKSTQDTTLYLNLSPCVHCAKLIINAGIKEVFYTEEYRDTDGINILKHNGIPCYKF